ncbi:MAG TPA: LytR C-terminal domain-containing protein, partial [Gaiellaceae bacterium]|nr:LytR C-terminal domain-containing protein [Gaiellaceae bacterium]
TDSDLTRVARQQQFVRAFKEQVAHSITYTRIPHLVSTITKNIEVGEGGHALQLDQVISYALFAQSLPGGHFFQDKIQNVDCSTGPCLASSSDIQAAVDQFQNPDVQAPTDANAAALGQKIKQTTLPPSSVSVTVLNGNGVQGAAANASYMLAQRGYQTLTPPNGLQADWPTPVFHSKIYYDPAQKGSKAAAVAMQNLMQPADVAKLPRTPRMLALDPGSMLMVVLGQTFRGTIASIPTRVVPKHEQATVRYDAGAAGLLKPYVKKVPFKLMVPTVLERYSSPDTLPGDKPIAYYWMDQARKHKGVRLVFHNGANEFWGVQETDFTAAPALADRSFHRILGGRAFDLYYSGTHLHMVVLRQGGSTYWVVNTLLDSLSNETMLAIAKGLKPLTSIH